MTPVNKRELHIVFCTSEPSAANEMLKSINNSLPNHTLSFAAVFIGQKETVDLSRFCLPVICIDTFKVYLSISESRNICQAYLKNRLEMCGGFGLVLDDDLRWVMPEVEFEILCDQLLSKGCDMAFSALTGDSPVPKEYTRASPILDILLQIAANNTSPSVSKILGFIKDIHVVGEAELEVNCHHDYYAYDKNSFYNAVVDINSINWNDFLSRLYIGKQTTRLIDAPRKITLASGRERGGATLIFNPFVLEYLNQSIQCGSVISRRSDMIMATNAKLNGYALYNTPALLSHNRTDSFDTHDSCKLIGDILGYSLVESYRSGIYCTDQFLMHLSERLVKTRQILQDTSIMLTLLLDWLREQNKLNEEIEKNIKNIILENTNTDVDIKSLDLSEAILESKTFSDSGVLRKYHRNLTVSSLG